MHPSSFIKLSTVMISLLFFSACSSDPVEEEIHKRVAPSSYYITPLNAYDRQASLGESDVEALGNLRQSAQNPLYTGTDTINLEMNYDSQGYSDNLGSFGKWRHSFSKSMDQYRNIDYDALDIKSQMYDSKEDVCLSGFDEIKDRAYSAVLADATASFDVRSDTCSIRNNEGKLLLTLPIFSPSEQGHFHIFTREDGETLVFVPTEEGTFESTTDKRVRLRAHGSEWKLVNSDDTIETYGEEGELLSVMSQGLRVDLEYDSDKRLKSLEDAFGNVVSLAYDEVGFISEVRNSKDEIINHFEIQEGELRAVYLSNADEILELFKAEYEEDGKLSTLSYEESEVSFSYRYNEDTQVIHRVIKDTDGNILDENSFHYTPEGVTIRDENNNTTEITFDMMASNIKTLSVTNSVDGNSSTLSLTYDEAGFLERLQNSDFVTTLQHNFRGLITSIISDNNLSIAFGYDETHNRPTQITQGDDIQTIIYDRFGAIIASIKERYNEFISRSSARRDALMTRYTYDEKGRLLSVKPANAPQRSVLSEWFSSEEVEALPSIFDENYETLLSSWNIDMNEAKPHAETYYKDANAKYYDWVELDKPGFEESLKDKSYIFIGYSYGGDSVLELSTRDLSETPNLKVDLIITIDPVGWVPTFEPNTKKWINVTAQTTVKTIKSGHFEYVGRKWGIPRYKWVKTVKSIPRLDESDLLASAGGKETYLPLIDGAGDAHEQINYTGHHTSFDCMLAEVSNRYPEIGLFKVDADDSREGRVIEGCGMGSGSITLVDQ